MNPYNPGEMGNFANDYFQNKPLICPSCHNSPDWRIDLSDLIKNQAPDMPKFETLIVECPCGRSGQIPLRQRS